MQTTFQKIKESVANPEIRLLIAQDSEVRFALQIELAAIVAQWVGLYANNFMLVFLGLVGFWYGVVKYVKNILRVHDEWKAEKEKKEVSSNDNNEENKED